MPTSLRILLFTVLSVLPFCGTACNAVPKQMLRQSQLRARQLYEQNQALAAERDQARQSAQALANQKQQLEQANSALKSDLQVANRRLDNLQSERSELKDRYVSLLNKAKNEPSPLSQQTTRRFEELARKYPEFEFDPQTGVSKFHSDILFASGSANIKSSADPVLQEFAEIMNDGDAQRLKILVVGHTDDQPIVKSKTKAKHPTNWHLSTDRADSVVLALEESGITPERMGAAGYSKYQPLVPNKDAEARQRNRRVEIFVLAPDAALANWDPQRKQRQ